MKSVCLSGFEAMKYPSGDVTELSILEVGAGGTAMRIDVDLTCLEFLVKCADTGTNLTWMKMAQIISVETLQDQTLGE